MERFWDRESNRLSIVLYHVDEMALELLVTKFGGRIQGGLPFWDLWKHFSMRIGVELALEA